MPIGPGGLDSEGIWQFGESDSESLMSDLLNLLAASVSTQIALDRARLEDLEAIVPSRFWTAVNAASTIVSTSFVTLPTNPCARTITVPAGGRLARISYDFHGVCTAGTMDIGLAVSGATTVAADQAWTGSAHATAPGGYATVFGATFNHYRVQKFVYLNAGSNTITAVGRIGGAGGTKQATNQLLTIELL